MRGTGKTTSRPAKVRAWLISVDGFRFLWGEKKKQIQLKGEDRKVKYHGEFIAELLEYVQDTNLPSKEKI